MVTPGKLLYTFYYRPLEVVCSTLKNGLWRTAKTNVGRLKMKQAAGRLTEIIYQGKPSFQVYFLTGKKYWFQTAFCLYSLQRSSDVNIHAIIVDDGSFNDELEQNIKRQFPTTITIIRSEQINHLLNKILPESDFPILRQRRIVYPHLRKLTDIHILPGDGVKLVLDSDMLFFRKPKELLDWFREPSSLIFMRDITEAYGYSHSLMKQLSGQENIPERLNVGVAGISSKQIDWQQIEYWIDAMLKKEGSSYLQEQALTAMIAAKSSYRFLNEEAYKVLPSIKGPKVSETLHHYVADSKYDYFVKGWKYFVS